MDPIERIIDCLARARVNEPFDPTAAALATSDLHGAPSVRFVLVKQIDQRGLAFYTNERSRKGRELDGNPRAALAFHWHTIGEQVRVEGEVQRVDADEADRYFASRPRASQLGAWASAQSEPIPDRDALDRQLQQVSSRFGDGAVPRPPHWGGYRIVPDRIEFWRDQPGRFHDRELFRRDPTGWSAIRLQP